MSLAESLNLAISIIAIGSAISTGVLYYKARVIKSYAAERDFNHIRNNLRELNNGISELWEEAEEKLGELKAELKEVKAYSIALSQRFETILTRLESNSILFGKRKED